MSDDRIVPVILSGGVGTRLWPVSRPEKPKQFHALTGDKTMLQMTAERVADAARYARPIVVASDRHADEVEAQLDGEPLLILEPAGRNTAAAIALAALSADSGDLLLVMPSDHVIGRPDRFHEAVARAVPLARQGYLVTFGITPSSPETGYGYIRAGDILGEGAFTVSAFVEKPDRETAARYVAEGGYAWNGGIFLFQAGPMIAALEAHAPDILEQVRSALERARREGSRIHPDPAAFAAVRSQSIDYAVMERHDRTAMVPVEMDWSDVGSWDAICDLAGEASGNSLSGPIMARDVSNCLLRSDGPQLVAVGVEDLIVVATGDVVLVARRGESQRVKEMVDALNERAAGAAAQGQSDSLTAPPA